MPVTLSRMFLYWSRFLAPLPRGAHLRVSRPVELHHRPTHPPYRHRWRPPLGNSETVADSESAAHTVRLSSYSLRGKEIPGCSRMSATFCLCESELTRAISPGIFCVWGFR